MISDIDIENDHEHHQMINIWSIKCNIWELFKKREKNMMPWLTTDGTQFCVVPNARMLLLLVIFPSSSRTSTGYLYEGKLKWLLATQIIKGQSALTSVTTLSREISRGCAVPWPVYSVQSES